MAPPPEPPHSNTGIVLTAVAVLGCWRWSEFQDDVARLREAGHVIDVEECPGVFERRVRVTADLGILNLLLGEDLQR